MKEFKDPVDITITCKMCNREFTVRVERADYETYFVRNEGLIQHVFPYLTEDQRELLIGNICGECFDKLFKDEE